MPIEDFMIFVFCCVEELMNKACKGIKIRQRGFSPKLSDSEVITIEIVGEFLGFDSDKKIWEYFQRHWISWFPNLPCRTTFVRQAANLWKIKQILQRQLTLDLGAFKEDIHIIDGFPIPVCHFARAKKSKLFKGEASYGRCAAKKQAYFGFKGHLLITKSGIITSFMLTPANVEEHNVVEDLTQGIHGLLIGDKGFISESLKNRLKRKNINLQTPLKKNMKDERCPNFVIKIKKMRRIVETVIGQLNESFNFVTVWAQDSWHAMARFSRKIFAHTIGAFINMKFDRPPIKFAGLISI